MKILFDTNVVLDLLLDRKPFSDDGAALFGLVEGRIVCGYLSATTVTTIFYLVTKARNDETARSAVRSLLVLCEVAPVNGEILDRALKIPFRDYEDAVIYEAAKTAGIDMIVTRNKRDFPAQDIAVNDPTEALKIINNFMLKEEGVS